MPAKPSDLKFSRKSSTHNSCSCLIFTATVLIHHLKPVIPAQDTDTPTYAAESKNAGVPMIPVTLEGDRSNLQFPVRNKDKESVILRHSFDSAINDKRHLSNVSESP